MDCVYISFALIVLQSSIITPTRGCVGEDKDLTVIIDSTRHVTLQDFSLQKSFIDILLNEMNKTKFRLSVQVYSDEDTCKRFSDDFEKSIRLVVDRDEIRSRLDTLKYRKSTSDYDLACIKSLLSSQLVKDNSLALILATNQSVESEIRHSGRFPNTSRLVCLISKSSTESYSIVQMMNVENCIQVIREMICGQPKPSISNNSSLQNLKTIVASTNKKLDSIEMTLSTQVTSSTTVEAAILPSTVVSSSRANIKPSSLMDSRVETTSSISLGISSSATKTSVSIATSITSTFSASKHSFRIPIIDKAHTSSVSLVTNTFMTSSLSTAALKGVKTSSYSNPIAHKSSVSMKTSHPVNVNINSDSSLIRTSSESKILIKNSPMIQASKIFTSHSLNDSMNSGIMIIKQQNISSSASQTPILFSSMVTKVTKPLLKLTSSSVIANASGIPTKKDIQLGNSSVNQSKSKAYPFIDVSEQRVTNMTSMTPSDVLTLSLTTIVSSISSNLSSVSDIKVSHSVAVSNGSSTIPKLQPSLSLKNNFSSSIKTPALQLASANPTKSVHIMSSNASTTSIKTVSESHSIFSDIINSSRSVTPIAVVPVKANISAALSVNATQLPFNVSKASVVLAPSSTTEDVSSNSSSILVPHFSVNSSRGFTSIHSSSARIWNYTREQPNWSTSRIQRSQSMANFSVKSSATSSFNKSVITYSTTSHVKAFASSITVSGSINSSLGSSLVKLPGNNTYGILPSTSINLNGSFNELVSSSSAAVTINVSVDSKSSSLFRSSVFVGNGSIVFPLVASTKVSTIARSQISTLSSLVVIASSSNKSIAASTTIFLPWKPDFMTTIEMAYTVASSHYWTTSTSSIFMKVSTSLQSSEALSPTQMLQSTQVVAPHKSTAVDSKMTSNVIFPSSSSRAFYLNSSVIFVPPKKEKKLITDIKRFMDKEATSSTFSNFTWVENFVEESSTLLDQLQKDNSSEIMNNSLPLVQYLEDIFLKVARHTSKTKGRRFKSKALSVEVKPIDIDTFGGYTFESDTTRESVKGKEGVYFPASFFNDQVINDDTSLVVMEYKPLPVMQQTRNDNFKIADKVFVINVEPPLQTPFKQPFKYVIDLKVEPKYEVQCVYWNKGSWDTKGCETTKNVNSSLVVCECNHMTPFSVLMQVKEYEIPEVHRFVLSLITYIGCGISIAACLVLVLSFMMCGNLVKIDRNIIHINLAIAIALSNALFIVADSVYKYKYVCLGVSIAMLYSFLSSFFWMLVEGMHVYLMVVKVFKSTSKVKVYMLTGWFLPAVIVAIAAVKYHQHFVRPNFCWISTDHFLIWIFVGPALFVLTVNTIILITTLSASHKMCLNELEFHKLRQVARLTLLLMPVFGLSWVFGVLAVNKETIIFQYIFTGLNSFQGLFLFICYCLMNSEVRREYDRVRRKSTSSKSNGYADSAFSTYTHYSTQKNGRPRHSSALSSEDVPSSVLLTRYDPNGDVIHDDLEDDENAYPESVSNTLTKRHKKNYSIELVKLPNLALSDEENLEEPTDVTGLLTVNDKHRDIGRSSTFSDRSSRQDRTSSIDDLLRTEGNVYKTFQNQEDGTYALAYLV